MFGGSSGGDDRYITLYVFRNITVPKSGVPILPSKRPHRPNSLHTPISSIKMADVVKGDEEWMVLDKEGKQPMLGQRYKPDVLHLNLGIVGTPYGKLSAKHKEEVLMLVVRLNGGRGDSNVIAAVSKELMELDMGDWHEVTDVARHLVKRDHNADSAKLQIIVSPKPDFLRNFRLTKANKMFPLLAVAANKLLFAHTTSCAAERNWSAWGYVLWGNRIYTSLRNKLDLETAEKLVYVKANMPEEWYS